LRLFPEGSQSPRTRGERKSLAQRSVNYCRLTDPPGWLYTKGGRKSQPAKGKGERVSRSLQREKRPLTLTRLRTQWGRGYFLISGEKKKKVLGRGSHRACRISDLDPGGERKARIAKKKPSGVRQRRVGIDHRRAPGRCSTLLGKFYLV